MILKIVPIWVWGILATLAWGGWQRHEVKVAKDKAHEAQMQEVKQEKEKLEGDVHASQAVAEKYAAADKVSRARIVSVRNQLSELQRATAAAEQAPASSAPARADGSSGDRQIAGECPARLVEVAEAATGTENRLAALQQWVRGVCTRP